MTSFDHANGVAALAAVAFAFATPAYQRKGAVILAMIFALNWWHYVQSYAERPLVAPLWDRGVPLASNDLWSLFDALTAMAALVLAAVKRAWWAAVIFVLATTQVAFHALYWDLRWIAKPTYYPALDKLFLAQVAVFIFAGGGGIVAWIARRLDRVRHAGRAGAPTHYQAR